MTRAYFSSGAFGNFAVQVDGLSGLQAWFKEADPKMKRALTRTLKDVSQPVLRRARANAEKIADDGTMKSSLSIATRKSGAEIVLKSTDPAAGVKEFAHLGARYSVSPSDKRANARKMGTFPVGVPRRTYAPRVMVPAVNDSTDEIESRVYDEIDRVLAEAANGK